MKKKYFIVSFILFALVFYSVSNFRISGSKKSFARNKSTYKDLSTFTEILSLIEQNYVNKIEPKKVIRGAINGMLRSLDPHSSYMTPEMFKQMQVETSGQFGGLGITITLRKSVLTIVSPIEGTPAFRAGVKAKDQIVKINGKSTKDITIYEAVKKLRGRPGSQVKITIFRRSTKKMFDLSIVREVIKIKSVKTKLLKGKIPYIRIRNFQSRTSLEVRTGLSKMSKFKKNGLIIDLRNNPGGLLSQAVGVSELFLPAGKLIVYTKGRVVNQNRRFISKEDQGIQDFPIVVIVNAGSASASEIVAAALQDWKRATVLGEKTFGKGSVQTVIPLEDGSGLRLTTSLYFTPKNRLIQGIGIAPDIKVVDPSRDKFVVREKDLPRHLRTNRNKDKGKLKKNKNEKSLISFKNKDGVKDYQLERAVIFLKKKTRR
ncbi:MAG: S41 family peptidase [Nitrospinota bacterium]|nr:S41 family peptidase [Nitrospinota bacterium]